MITIDLRILIAAALLGFIALHVWPIIHETLTLLAP